MRGRSKKKKPGTEKVLVGGRYFVSSVIPAVDRCHSNKKEGWDGDPPPSTGGTWFFIDYILIFHLWFSTPNDVGLF